MRNKAMCLLAVMTCLPVYANAQLSQDTRVVILGSLIAAEAEARIPMPLGKAGVEVSSNGLVHRDKLQKELAENSQAILPGKIVSITAIEFNDKSIEFEIDGGGTKKKNILSNIQIGVGGASTKQDEREKTSGAKGSKITLLFPNKLPKDITPDEMKDFLNPVLDFSKQSINKTGIEALPPEFQDAVKAKEARIGMDSNTVLLAMGRPNRRERDENASGIEQEDWIYNGRGRRQTFVTFERGIVVSVRQY